ncbi:MAG: hypothetical protein L0216_16870 [Planctomycetales bacterium]|nr:hypothetical protein [Planctomycetales bacterium]
MSVPKFAVALVAATCFLGCTHIVAPESVPPVELDVVGNLSGQISVEADGTSAPLNLAWSQGFHHFYTDPLTWNSFMAQDLAGELGRRGVQVSPQARNKAIVTIASLTGHPGAWFTHGATVTLMVRDQTGRNVFLQQFVNKGASNGRAIGGALYHAKVALMNDPNFQALLR